MQCVLSAKVIYAYICKMETYALYISYSQSDVYVIVAISHLYAIFLFCIYIAFILNAMYMHLKQTHLYAIRSTMRYITHSKYRNWSKCDVRRILNCDIYRIYFLNAMYVASACGVLLQSAMAMEISISLQNQILIFSTHKSHLERAPPFLWMVGV